jgi:hypothetical protein
MWPLIDGSQAARRHRSFNAGGEHVGSASGVTPDPLVASYLGDHDVAA